MSTNRKKQYVKNRKKIRKRNVILVAEVASKRVKIIIECPHESRLRKDELDKIDLAIEQKANELFKQYRPNTYEVIRTRASDIDDLKQAFPEFFGWDTIAPQQLIA